MGPSSLLLYGEQKCLESKSATGGFFFFASLRCCELKGRFHHLHCKAALIMRNQTQSLAPNWSINNENGLCASCLLSNYPEARIESRFFASLPEWQAWKRQTGICMQCPWPGESVSSSGTDGKAAGDWLLQPVLGKGKQRGKHWDLPWRSEDSCQRQGVTVICVICVVHLKVVISWKRLTCCLLKEMKCVLCT